MLFKLPVPPKAKRPNNEQDGWNPRGPAKDYSAIGNSIAGTPQPPRQCAPARLADAFMPQAEKTSNGATAKADAESPGRGMQQSCAGFTKQYLPGVTMPLLPGPAENRAAPVRSGRVFALTLRQPGDNVPFTRGVTGFQKPGRHQQLDLTGLVPPSAAPISETLASSAKVFFFRRSYSCKSSRRGVDSECHEFGCIGKGSKDTLQPTRKPEFFKETP